MFNYCEIVKGGPHNRGSIVSLPEGVSNYDLDYYGKEVSDAFHSAFMQTEDYYHYDNNGTKKDYNGVVFSDYLYWDMDNENINKAASDTIELVERLYMYKKSENVRIYFSGGKGFHVYYMCPELKEFSKDQSFNELVKATCGLIASDLSSWDYKIYDKTRIIRTTNSIHPKTGLYKVPITYEELKSLNVDGIKELSKQQRKVVYEHSFDYDPDILKLLENAKQTSLKTVSKGLFDANELLQGIVYGFKEGERNTGFASVAGLLHSRNIDDDFIRAILSNINSNSSNPLPERDLETIVNSISRYPVNSKYIPVENKDIVTISEAGESWKNAIVNSGYTSFGDRFSHINDRMKLCIPGDTIAFLASSGVGKSTMGLELGNEEAKHRGMYSLFSSLEMSRGGVFFRAATIESSDIAIDGYVPSSEVAKTLLEKDSVLLKRVTKQWSNLLIVDKGGLSLDKVIEFFKKAQEKTDGKISNLVIDYFQNLDDVEKIDVFMNTARRLKDVAKELNTKLFVLLQTNKTLPDDYTEPQKNHAEGAGAIFQAMDYIITAWKSRDNKLRLHSKLLKDRWGSSDYKFDFVREGLKYHTEDYIPDSPFGGL